MRESEHIINRFSDAYVASMLDGTDVSGVLISYEQSYPELAVNFRERSQLLSVLYGDLSTTEYDSEQTIAAVYQKFALPESSPMIAKTESGLFARLASVFASITSVRLATGLAVVVLGLFLWRPWDSNSGLGPNGAGSTSDQQPSANAAAPTSTTSETIDPSKNASGDVQYRGSDNSSPASRSRSAEDIARLKKLSLTGQIARPQALEVEAIATHTVALSWQPVDGAVSYIVEIKSEKDHRFHAVMQVAHPHAKLRRLPSQETVSFRVTATKGPVKGPASDAQSIVIP